MRSTRLIVVLALTTTTVGMVAWLLASQRELHDRLAAQSPVLGAGFVVVTTLTAAGMAGVVTWQLVRWSRPPKPPVQAPEDVVKAAEVQLEKAGAMLDQVKDQTLKEQLNRELAEIKADTRRKQFHVVVFGTGSAGKTSLINALLGRPVGKTEATIGTTKHGENYTHAVEGVEGTVFLTDTPGLADISQGGPEREHEARDLAARADLLLFVVDHDLIRSEHEPLVALARQGKRSILVLNKVDRLTDADRAEILAKLRERLAGVVAAKDVVPVSASPRPTPVRVLGVDGQVTTALEAEPPDLSDLRKRIEAVLDREGDALRAGNLLLRAHLVSQSARDQIGRERAERARQVVEKFQWITAGTVFVNPIPALDLMATGAVQFQMISELAQVYGIEVSGSHLKTIAGQMVQMLLKLGIVEAASSLVAGVFKSSIVGYAAGGGIQAVTMAYLTHISGLTFIEYFQRGQTWGDGGLQAALARQFDLHSRSEFLKEFAQQALERVKHKYFQENKQNAG